MLSPCLLSTYLSSTWTCLRDGIAHVLAGDAAGSGQEAHGFPITAVERKSNPHPLAVVAANLKAENGVDPPIAAGRQLGDGRLDLGHQVVVTTPEWGACSSCFAQACE
jgi:hypothetical protein